MNYYKTDMYEEAARCCGVRMTYTSDMEGSELDSEKDQKTAMRGKSEFTRVPAKRRKSPANNRKTKFRPH